MPTAVDGVAAVVAETSLAGKDVNLPAEGTGVERVKSPVVIEGVVDKAAEARGTVVFDEATAAGELAHRPSTAEHLVAAAVVSTAEPPVRPAGVPVLNVVSLTPEEGLVLGRYTAGVSVCGEDRMQNEVAILQVDALHASVVCDGHGDYGVHVAETTARAIGESLIWTALVSQRMPPEDRLRRAIADAVAAVKGDPRADVSGTTASIALVEGGRV